MCDIEGWTQERIAKAKGNTQAMVSYRLKLNDELPAEIKTFITQDKLTEKHCREILPLSPGLYFSPWLFTSDLWITLAELAIEKKLSVSKLKTEVDRWKKVIAKANDLHGKLDEQVKIGEVSYLASPKGRPKTEGFPLP